MLIRNANAVLTYFPGTIPDRQPGWAGSADGGANWIEGFLTAQEAAEAVGMADFSLTLERTIDGLLAANPHLVRPYYARLDEAFPEDEEAEQAALDAFRLHYLLDTLGW